ncbi:DUF4105 domain-containing protein [Hymenobacter setariae]|uniref:DUF4105 domain-containing protein n=1 Tax=Hymenobacter setariae TaxID=2594794 RepID=A0A558BJW3_9BACT|nr:DUF4105 domain-containing protein [Hymenobacter setariae]TVT36804.1 DUF4105 domain-containing protein [Hymenobacter setariae]
MLPRPLAWVLLCLTGWVITPLAAMPRPLSPTTTVSLITCAPGTETYSLFGHSALRITDPSQGLDQVYNYGTFDFSTPNFYGRFLRGDLSYFLSATSFATFYAAYQAEQRPLTEQVLALRPAETQRAYDYLEASLASSARFYRYQFFADNCTTRLYDVIMRSVTGSVQLDSTYVPAGQTYRQLLAPYLAPSPWVKLGMNLGLGWPADRLTTFRQRLFLPTELSQAWTHTSRQHRPFVTYTRSLLTAPVLPDQPLGWGTPQQVFCSLAILLALAACLPARYDLLAAVLGRGVLAAVGLTGCLLVGLHLFSLHTPAHYNYQLLWLLPTHLFLAVTSPRHWWRPYTTGAIALLMVGSLLGYWLYYSQLMPEIGWLLGLLLGQLLLLRRQCSVVGQADIRADSLAN